MKKRFTGKLQLGRWSLRPIFYQVCSRAAFGACAALLFDRFFGSRVPQARAWVFLIAAVFCALGAWCAWLRLDGLQLMRFDRAFLRPRRPQRHGTPDLIDYVDEEIVPYDELEDSEKDVCLVVANSVCAVALGALSFL